MKELLKNQYKNVILVCCYIIITTLVYTVSADCIFDIWYIDVIVGILVAALGVYIGYKYIKSEEDNRIKKIAEQENTVKEENVVEETKENEESANENDEIVEDNKNEE